MKGSTVKKVVYCILPIIGALLAVGFMLDKNNEGFSDIINIIAVYLAIVAIVISPNNNDIIKRLDKKIKLLEKKEP